MKRRHFLSYALSTALDYGLVTTSPFTESSTCAAGETIPTGRFGASASSITIADTVYQRVYQRVGTSKSVTVAGSTVGAASRIEARHCPAGTAVGDLATTYPWSVLLTEHPGGTFSAGYAVPQGDGWIVQVRDGANHSVASSGTHRFGVGVFIALIGQSNMENMFWSNATWPYGSDGTYTYDKKGFVRLGRNNESVPPGSVSVAGCSYGDGLVLMANSLRASLAIPVVILRYAAGGTSIVSYWQPGKAALSTLLNGVDLIGGDFEAAIWLQGENDAQNNISAAAYQGYLQTLFNTCKLHTGRSSSQFHFGVVIVGPGDDVKWTYGPEGAFAKIRKGQLDFVAANLSNGAYLAGTDIDGNLATKNIHIDQASLFRQGRRYAESIKRRLTGAKYNIEGPKITGATRSGAVVTVAIQHNGGSSLANGAGGSTLNAPHGFRVFDGGIPCTISSAVISGASVVLTLSTAPSGVMTIDYAMANSPFGRTTNPASVVYDNQTVPNDTLGLPLQPFAVITVTQLETRGHMKNHSPASTERSSRAES